MEDIIQLNNEVYIRAASLLTDQKQRVLKYGEIFGVFDLFGDIKFIGRGVHGIFKESTRYLSQWEMRIQNSNPMFLSSTIRNDNAVFTADLSNVDIRDDQNQLLLKGNLHLFREKFLFADACYERITVTNFTEHDTELSLSFHFQCDYMDMFEIRGVDRRQRGRQVSPESTTNQITFHYEGLDLKVRKTRISFAPEPSSMSVAHAQFKIKCKARSSSVLHATIELIEDGLTIDNPQSFEDAFERIDLNANRAMSFWPLIHSSSERFNSWWMRSRSDIDLMTTQTELGPYPYAGVPWFNAVFGRDGIITALQTLWLHPELARGVLTTLAHHQAKEVNPNQDAEPGKILHEARRGEMVELGEVPFKLYYGSADATPLFVVLAGKYWRRTGDLEYIKQIWPSIMAALNWIDKYGDIDGDGFVEYHRQTKEGLINQGWKDSHDSISHADGRLATGPIALCEIQGYVYDAKCQAAALAEALNMNLISERLTREALELKIRFNEKFWSERLGCYVLALDGEKKQCEVLSSNAGHALFSQIADSERAPLVARALMSKEMRTTWGIRTLSMKEVRYNPMSYHNGSIWPHDNSLIAEGFSRYNLKEEALSLLTSLFEASNHMDLWRLPELYCGFSSREGEGPTLYPVACSPQSWAAGSIFLLLKAALGLQIDGVRNRVSMTLPVLPSFIDRLQMRNLHTPSATVDLSLRRHGDEVSVYVERRKGEVEVHTIK